MIFGILFILLLNADNLSIRRITMAKAPMKPVKGKEVKKEVQKPVPPKKK